MGRDFMLLFDRASSLVSNERERFVDEIDDEGVRGELSALLRALRVADDEGFLSAHSGEGDGRGTGRPLSQRPRARSSAAPVSPPTPAPALRVGAGGRGPQR